MSHIYHHFWHLGVKNQIYPKCCSLLLSRMNLSYPVAVWAYLNVRLFWRIYRYFGNWRDCFKMNIMLVFKNIITLFLGKVSRHLAMNITVFVMYLSRYF